MRLVCHTTVSLTITILLYPKEWLRYYLLEYFFVTLS